MLKSRLESRAGTELVVLLGGLGWGRGPRGGGEAREEAEVTEDNSLPKQGRGVGGLNHLLRLGLLTLHLENKDDQSGSQM